MDYLPPREAVRLVRALSPVMRRLRRAPAAPRSALDSVLARYRRHAATWTLATARLYLAAAFRILDAHRPDAVVITSDRRMSEQALARAARARGIPTLLYWGGAILGRDRSGPSTSSSRRTRTRTWRSCARSSPAGAGPTSGSSRTTTSIDSSAPPTSPSW